MLSLVLSVVRYSEATRDHPHTLNLYMANTHKCLCLTSQIQRRQKLSNLSKKSLDYSVTTQESLTTPWQKQLHIATTQAAPTLETMKKVSHLLNYAASHPNNCIIYESSDIILTAHSDASRKSVKNSRSKAGGAFYLANKNDPPTTNNGLIGVYSKIIPVVCAAASDAEYAALFQIAQLMYFYRIVCEACGYP